MNELLNAVASMLFSAVALVAAMAALPLLLKVLLPIAGEPTWRASWRLVQWMFPGSFATGRHSRSRD